MRIGELESAKRRALNIFDTWNDVTGFVPEHTSYYYELQGVVEDAVECGAQAALGIHELLECEQDTIWVDTPWICSFPGWEDLENKA